MAHAILGRLEATTEVWRVSANEGRGGLLTSVIGHCTLTCIFMCHIFRLSTARSRRFPRYSLPGSFVQHFQSSSSTFKVDCSGAVRRGHFLLGHAARLLERFGALSE